MGREEKGGGGREEKKGCWGGNSSIEGGERVEGKLKLQERGESLMKSSWKILGDLYLNEETKDRTSGKKRNKRSQKRKK